MSLPDKTDLDNIIREIMCYYSKYFELVLRGYKMGELEQIVHEAEVPNAMTADDFNKTVVKIQRECDPVAGQRKRLEHQPVVSDPVISLDGFKDVLAMLAAVRFADFDESIAQTTLLLKFVLPLHARLDAEGAFNHLPWRRPAMLMPARRRKGISIVSEPTPEELRRGTVRSPGRPGSSGGTRLKTLKSGAPPPLPMANLAGDDPIAELDRQLNEIRMTGALWKPDSQLKAPDQSGLPFTAAAFAEVIAASNPVVTSSLFDIYASTLCVQESVPLIDAAISNANGTTSQLKYDPKAPSGLRSAQEKVNTTVRNGNTVGVTKITTSSLALHSLTGSVAPFMSADAFFQCVTDCGVSPGYIKDEVLADIFSRCCKKRAPPPTSSVDTKTLSAVSGGALQPSVKTTSRAAAAAKALMEARKRGGVGQSAVGTSSVTLEDTLSTLEFADCMAMVALAAAAEVKLSQPMNSPLLDVSDARLALRLLQQWGLLDDSEGIVFELKKRQVAKQAAALSPDLAQAFHTLQATSTMGGFQTGLGGSKALNGSQAMTGVLHPPGMSPSGGADPFPMLQSMMSSAKLNSDHMGRPKLPSTFPGQGADLTAIVSNFGPAPYLDPNVSPMQGQGFVSGKGNMGVHTPLQQAMMTAGANPGSMMMSPPHQSNYNPVPISHPSALGYNPASPQGASMFSPQGNTLLANPNRPKHDGQFYPGPLTQEADIDDVPVGWAPGYAAGGAGGASSRTMGSQVGAATGGASARVGGSNTGSDRRHFGLGAAPSTSGVGSGLPDDQGSSLYYTPGNVYLNNSMAKTTMGSPNRAHLGGVGMGQGQLRDREGLGSALRANPNYMLQGQGF